MCSSPPPFKPGPTTRYNFRRRSSPSANNDRRRSSSPDSDRRKPAPRPDPPKKSGANPLDKLLREKKKDDKSGKGIEGLRRAEEILRDAALEKVNKGKGWMREEMDMDEDSEDEDAWTHRRARRHGMDDDSDSDEDDEGGNELDLAEATKHLEAGQGEAVERILDSDRKGRMLKGRNKKRMMKGLPLWRDAEAGEDELAMKDEYEPAVIAPMPFGTEEVEGDRILQVLHTAIAAGGERHISLHACFQADELLFRHESTMLPSKSYATIQGEGFSSSRDRNMAFLVRCVSVRH